MGIDIGSAQWAYSGFHRFRTQLAKAEGIDLDQMVGFERRDAPSDRRPWTDDVGNDITVLRPFLEHSDCDGVLRWEECAQVSRRIEEIVNSWTGDDFISRRDAEQGRALVESMRECIKDQVALEFR